MTTIGHTQAKAMLHLKLTLEEENFRKDAVEE